MIEVRQLFGHTKLDLDGYPQTNDHYFRYWTKLYKLTGMCHAHASLALMLGLGGGILANLLANRMQKLNTTFVELENEVVDVARDYFGITDNTKRKIVVGDAKVFMGENIKKYDLVIVDLYSGDDVPIFVSGTKFLNQIKLAIGTKGKAIFNYASHSFRKLDFVQFELKLQARFTNVNKVVYSGHTFYLANN
jgi:spermidine synthase